MRQHKDRKIRRYVMRNRFRGADGSTVFGNNLKVTAYDP